MLLAELPENVIAGVLQAEISRPVKTFTNITTFPDLPTSLVFLLLRRPDFAEVQLDVGRELKRGTVERTGFLFRQPRLELLESWRQRNLLLWMNENVRMATAASGPGMRARRRAGQRFDEPDGDRRPSTPRRIGR